MSDTMATNLPPCPVCGSPIKVMVESEWTFSWRCQPDNAESWHEMWLNNRDEYIRLCELVEAGRMIRYRGAQTQLRTT